MTRKNRTQIVKGVKRQVGSTGTRKRMKLRKFKANLRKGPR
jgi:hypothetical protein